MDEREEAGDEDVMDGPGDLSDDALRLWRAATAMNAAALARDSGSVSLPPLLFFTDPQRTPRPWETAARLPAGAAVVYRHFGAVDAAEVAGRLRAVTANRGVRLLIGLDADLARAAGADGVHLPERALNEAWILRERHPGWLLTGAAHTVAAATTAPGALHAVVLSPIFAAGGASGAKAALGVDALASAVRGGAGPAYVLPVYALGGVNARTVDRLSGAGACGIAGVDALQRAFSSPADFRT